MASQDTPELVEYEGMCHCTAVRFTAKVPPVEANPVIRDNCSICSKNGYLMVYPKVDDVVFTQGKENLKEYRCMSKRAPHYFCSTCGSSVYCDTSAIHPLGKVYAVNVGLPLAVANRVHANRDQVRMFRGVDLHALKFDDKDGKNLIAPEFNEKTW